MNLSIFKSYDIRGIYPAELDKETAYKVGRAFVGYTGAKKIIIGQDMRLSSPILFNGLVKGIIDQGADVCDIGKVATECIYFAVGSYDCDAGIMITASHNPKEYNGFKMIKRVAGRVEMVRGNSLVKIIEAADFSKSEKKGTVRDMDIWPDYLEHVFSFVDVDKIRPFRVVVDAGNGMAGKVIPFLAKRLPVNIISLDFDLDGNFPSRPSNPLEEGAANRVSKAVKENRADFGFIFDGDADRIFLIDELGNLISGDISLLLLARYLLRNNSGSGIAYNLICSKAVPVFVRKWGGRPIRTKVGFVNVREGMMKNNGIMGGELSGHFSFKDNFYCDSGFISFLILLQVFSETGKNVSILAKELSPYFKLPEINFKVQNKKAILEKIREQFSGGKQDYLDGITVEYNDWWFNLRPSQTEPFLRLTIEADNEKLLEEKKEDLVNFIKRRK